MRCPYCIEEIDDRATYCRYCHQNLLLKAQLNRTEERTSIREKQVSDLVTSINSLASAEPHQSAVSPPYFYITLVASLAPLLIAGTGFVRTSSTSFTSQLPLYIVLHAGILILGFWIGISWLGKHLKGYALLGAAVGATGYIMALLIELNVRAATNTSGYIRASELYSDNFSGFALITLLFTVGEALLTMILFILGGLLGDTLERWRPLRNRKRSAPS